MLGSVDSKLLNWLPVYGVNEQAAYPKTLFWFFSRIANRTIGNYPTAKRGSSKRRARILKLKRERGSSKWKESEDLRSEWIPAVNSVEGSSVGFVSWDNRLVLLVTVTSFYTGIMALDIRTGQVPKGKKHKAISLAIHCTGIVWWKIQVQFLSILKSHWDSEILCQFGGMIELYQPYSPQLLYYHTRVERPLYCSQRTFSGKRRRRVCVHNDDTGI